VTCAKRHRPVNIPPCVIGKKDWWEKGATIEFPDLYNPVVCGDNKRIGVGWIGHPPGSDWMWQRYGSSVTDLIWFPSSERGRNGPLTCQFFDLRQIDKVTVAGLIEQNRQLEYFRCLNRSPETAILVSVQKRWCLCLSHFIFLHSWVILVDKYYIHSWKWFAIQGNEKKLRTHAIKTWHIAAWSLKSAWTHECWRKEFDLWFALDRQKQVHEQWMRFMKIPRSGSISGIITQTLLPKYNFDWLCSWLCLLEEVSDEMRW
jgi:hypothetical protein